LGRLIECDVFHCSGVQPCHPRGSLPVVTMHDLTAYENPEWHTRATIEYAERERILVEKRGAAVVTGSQWAAGMAESFFGLEGRERVWAIGGAADDLFCPGKPDRSVLARYGLEAGRFLLMVGNLEPRKNIGFALAVHEKAIGMGLGMPVALVGKAGWRLGTASLSSSRNVRLLRNVPDRQLLELYRGCRAVLLPSLCEGLGLVALEAMACGAPLISSNSGALPETVGRGGLLLDPGDASGWVSCLMSLRDDAFARDLRLRALGMPRRGWSRVGERLCAVYGKLAR
ncbi:glycosyltransferase family 4 protein, partial [Candidatus Fermentibacterales bacterium]|nr:glycosyltransferase family 4 protein [Candidatus Fermentibacterales bacterium]